RPDAPADPPGMAAAVLYLALDAALVILAQVRQQLARRAAVHLGLEVLRVRRGGLHAGQDGIRARLYQFVTLPAGHRHSCTMVEVNAQAKLAIAESHRVLLDCGPPSRAGCGAPAVRGRGLQVGR